jgi:hypothetical protein
MTKKDELGGSYRNNPRAAAVAAVITVLAVSTAALGLLGLVAVLTGGRWGWTESISTALLVLYMALCGVRFYAWLVHNRPYPRSFWGMVWQPLRNKQHR